MEPDGVGARPPVIQRARAVLRYEGIRGLVRKAYKHTLGRLVLIERFFFLNHHLEIVPVRLKIPVEFRVASPEDVAALADGLRRSGVEPDEARWRLERGDVGYFGILDGRLVYQGWDTSVSPHVDELGLFLSLGPGEICSDESFTVPEWRGHGIQRAATVFRDAERRRRGVERHFSWVRADNTQILRAHAKLGTPIAKTVWAVRVAGGRLFVLGWRGGEPKLVREDRRG